MLESQMDMDQFYTGSEEDHTLRDFTSPLFSYCEPAFLLDFTTDRKQLSQVALREGHLEFLTAWLADALARPSSTSQPLGKLMKQVAAEGKTVEILGLAAYRGSVDTFKQVPSHFAVFLDPEDPAYDTVLVSAVLGRHPETVQLFLDPVFDVNGLYPRKHGKSATLQYLAIRHPPFWGVRLIEESVTLARLLLRHGANVNLLSWKGNTALVCAIEQRSEELIELLLEKNDIVPLLQGGHRSSALHWALVAYPANPKYLKLLLTKVSIHDPRLQNLTHRLGARAQVWLETPPSSNSRDELQRWRAIWLDAEKSEEDSVEQSDSAPKPLQAMLRNNLWWTQFLALKAMRCYYWCAISPVPDL